MSITVRGAESDADLDAFIRIRRTLLPNESGGTIDLLRAQQEERPERRLVVAEFDGDVVGSGLVDRSDLRDRFSVKVRVLRHSRRRGVGTALLRELVAHASKFECDKIATHLEEEEARPFAERFGFRETDRQVEQVKRLGREPEPNMPDGVDVLTVADRPSLLRDAYPLACEGYADMALEAPAQISLEDWLREEATIPEGSFVALAEGEVVGYSGLMRHDNDGVAEDGLTVVRRDWRRRGLAKALKERELAWAAANGLKEVVTWTQRGNEAMRRLNERLGYEYRDVSITMVAPLPLTGLQ
jgi:mycothiol synthase